MLRCSLVLHKQIVAHKTMMQPALFPVKLCKHEQIPTVWLRMCADADMPCLAPQLAAPGAAQSVLPAAPIIDDSRGPKDPVDLAAAEAASGAVRIAAADAPASALSHLSLGGFCPVSFVKRAGLLVKADASLGFIRCDFTCCCLL